MEEEDDNDLNIRSESIQDIIGTNPPFIVRWGNTFLFLICVILISLCWIIRYPDVLSSQVTIKTSVNPKPIVARNDGKIVKLFVKDGNIVKKGQVVAYMESQADVKDILNLEKEVNRIDSLIKQSDWEGVKSISFPFNRFGEIQEPFEAFFISLQTLQAYWQGNILSGKKDVLNKEINNLNSLSKNLYEQEKEIKKDLKLTEDEYKANLNLFWEDAISLQDLRNVESKYIAKKVLYKQIQTAILNNTNAQFSSSKQLVDIADNIAQEKINFIRVLNLLKAAVVNWKNEFILKAPDAGKVSFSYSLEEYKLVPRNQDLFYVLPNQIDYMGELFLDQYNLGKVEVGQTVVIKLKSYPFEEYGVLKGTVENISEVDVENKYQVRVKLPGGLKTNMGKNLRFRFGLLGDAEVITKETRIIDKLIYKFQKAGQ